MTAQTTFLEDVAFKRDTMRVVRNMTERIEAARLEIDYALLADENPDDDSYAGAVRKIKRRYETNHAEMMRTFTMVVEYLSTPGVRLWPDNGREDCLSLSGSLHGMQFGIICRENSDSTCSWSFHS